MGELGAAGVDWGSELSVRSSESECCAESLNEGDGDISGVEFLHLSGISP